MRAQNAGFMIFFFKHKIFFFHQSVPNILWEVTAGISHNYVSMFKGVSGPGPFPPTLGAAAAA